MHYHLRWPCFKDSSSTFLTFFVDCWKANSFLLELWNFIVILTWLNLFIVEYSKCEQRIHRQPLIFPQASSGRFLVLALVKAQSSRFPLVPYPKFESHHIFMVFWRPVLNMLIYSRSLSSVYFTLHHHSLSLISVCSSRANFIQEILVNV